MLINSHEMTNIFTYIRHSAKTLDAGWFVREAFEKEVFQGQLFFCFSLEGSSGQWN